MSDRKYGHKGYQDSGKDDSRGKASIDEIRRKLDGAPRGRGVGSEAESVFKCGRCGQRVLSLDDLTPESKCRACQNPLHTCGQCAHYNPSKQWECSEEIPERIAKKHDRNDCAKFAPKIVLDLTGAKPATAGDARSAFDALFKK